MQEISGIGFSPIPLFNLHNVCYYVNINRFIISKGSFLTAKKILRAASSE